MLRKKSKKPKPFKIDDDLRQQIRCSAKVLSEAKVAYDQAVQLSLGKMAEKIGYADQEEILEWVNDNGDFSQGELEKLFIDYAQRAEIEFKQFEIDSQIEELELQKKELEKKSHSIST